MALGKMLNLGGMENSLPKTNQTPNRFRVAKNVQPSTDGKLIPRSSYETKSGQPNGILFYPLLKEYQEDIFKMAVKEPLPDYFEYEFYLNNTKIPQSSFQGGAIFGGTEDTSLAVMSYQKNKTLYVLNALPEQSFFKYDGVEITGCGSSQPRFSCAQYNAAGTDYVKVIQHRIDFDENEVLSEAVTFPILTATNTITIQTDGATTPIVSPSNLGVQPSELVSAFQNTMSDLFFFGTAAYNVSTEDYTITASETNITSTQIGNYVFLGNNSSISSYWPGLGYRLLALKVKSASPLVLDAKNAKAMSSGIFEWQDIPGPISTGIAGAVTFGFRKIFSVWGSASLTGNYTLRTVQPAFPESTVSRTFTADTTTMTTPVGGFSGQLGNLPVVVGANLGDFYDVNSRKISLNSTYNFGGNTGFLGMTSYQDQLLWWNDDIIFFSDPNLGGNLEAPSAGSFIRVGDSEYGKIVSVCGTQDYFVVSRERKNYFVNGNLATANYRVQDIAEIEIGAWCNNGMINVKDSIVMINATGVWQIQGGGRISHLSKQIPKNFSIYDGFPTDDDSSFRLNGFSTFPLTQPYVDTGLDIAFDEFREFLIFCQRSVSAAPMLVLHTKTGEFYEWVGFGESIRSVAFNKGVLHYGTVDKEFNTAAVKSELTFSMQQDYASEYPIQVYTTWLTAGEPSLEKQVLQIKMFGYVYPSNNKTINVTHYKDWDSSTKITDAEYRPDSSTQYSHLKRLTSDKALAVSIGFEIKNEDVTFSLDSIEVEFMPIQSGVKR